MVARNLPAVRIVRYWISRWIMVDVILLGAGPQHVRAMEPLRHAVSLISRRVNGGHFR